MKVDDKLKSLQELIEELDIDLLDDSIVKSNMLPFMHDDKLYRAKMPTQKDLTLAKAVEDTLKIKLLRDENSITRKSLIKVLKEKQDIDIEGLERIKKKYAEKLKDLYISLATTGEKEVKRVKPLKDMIVKVKQQHMRVSVEISDYLSVSIENQVETTYIKYLTALCTEKNVDKDEWTLVWPTVEDYDKDRTNLPSMADLCFSRLFLTLRN